MDSEKEAFEEGLARLYSGMTWKERHAKGVPVVMNTKEWRECLLKLPEGDLTEFCQLDISGVKYYRGAPSVTFMDKGIRATFCNFRYKQEWLDKKNELHIEEMQRKAWGGAWLDKKKDGSWVLPWHKDAHDTDVTSIDRGELWNSKPLGGVTEW